jgi:protein subunit release factor B
MSQSNKHDTLEERMQRLGIVEEDLIEKFILGSGSGGQKINKTASCVYLKHIPSSIEVKSQGTRSRDQNRILARTLLCEKLEERRLKDKNERQKNLAKLRQQKKRRTPAQKERMLEGKRHRSTKKANRRAKDDS